MEFRTVVDIPKGSFELLPCERMLFVGSCFADSIGRRAQEEKFRAVVNPYGVMYNPACILHSIQRLFENTGERVNGERERFTTAVLTLGTNHVYILKETGEIVDNCQKRPQALFDERELSVEECINYLKETVNLLRTVNPNIRIIFTVSPIRYRKYGYHESQLSKATLLLAIHNIVTCPSFFETSLPFGRSREGALSYFPAYELVLDELRDYRFYAPDMLHPSEQAVEYIWQRFGETFFGDAVKVFLNKWRPIKEALAHKPFHPDSPDYQAFLARTHEQLRLLKEAYPNLELSKET